LEGWGSRREQWFFSVRGVERTPPPQILFKYHKDKGGQVSKECLV